MHEVDIHQIVDDARFNKFHALILFWCALIIIFDGYDLAIAGAALPAIMKDMGVAPTQAGFMVSSALFGMMFGAIFLGTASDQFGRRRVISLCILLFSGFTAAAGLTKDPVLFSVARFIAGLGIGGVMPNVVAHMTEYAPKKIRATMVTLMFSGYAVGGMIAALLGKQLIESYGWTSVFFAAGAPLILIPLVLATLPESIAYLQRNGQQAALNRIVGRIDPSFHAAAGDQLVFPIEKHKAVPTQLFEDGRSLSTIMFWLAFFMCLFMVYALSSWLTKLMAGAGYSLGSALNFVLALNFGAMLGAIGGGWLADKFSIKWVLVGMFILSAISIALLGVGLPTFWLFIAVGLAGASTIGTQIVAYAYAGQFYPVAVRSTGIGFASGVGRLGAIIGPIAIGALVALKLPLEQNFYAIAIPGVISALAVAMIDHGRSHTFIRETTMAFNK